MMEATAKLHISEEDVTYIFSPQHKQSWSKTLAKTTTLLYVVITGFSLITTIVFIVLYVNQRYKTKCDPSVLDVSDKNNLCLTPYCIKAANNLLESIDETVDPCENFYEFSCGKLIQNTKTSSSDNEEDILSKMEKEMNVAVTDLLSLVPPKGMAESKAIINARRLYNSCVDEQAIEEEHLDEIVSLISTEFGGWPLWQDSTWNESTFNFSKLWFKLSKYHNSVFYHAETEISKRNISAYHIRISPSPLNLGNRIFYIDNSSYAQVYQQFMKDFIMKFTFMTRTINIDLKNIFDLEKKISKIHRATDARLGAKNIRTTINNLSRLINTSFDLTDCIRRLYHLANVTLANDDIVVLNDIEVLRNISSLIAHQSPRVLQNYMIWRFLIYLIPNMPKRFQTALDQLKKGVFGASEKPTRTSLCAEFANNNMGFAVSKLYINKYFNKLARIESMNMVDNIRNTFIDMINQSTWIDAISKKRTIEKAQAIIGKVGYPIYLDDDNMTQLESIYEEYNITTSHMKNVLTLRQLRGKENFRKLRKPINHQEWNDFSPTITNAFYHTLFNKIVVPAGILQPPYFHTDAPKYLNYGAMGAVIGHEITHGFDELRRNFDKDGKKYSSWSNETVSIFNKRSQCITEQYNNYTGNGKRTRDENIADNDGVKKAFFAYQKWIQTQRNTEKKLPGFTKYSSEQMFFISFGHIWCSKTRYDDTSNDISTDTHSPSQFRVNGPTSNFAEFDRVFQCKPGQGNSRINKCSVW